MLLNIITICHYGEFPSSEVSIFTNSEKSINPFLIFLIKIWYKISHEENWTFELKSWSLSSPFLPSTKMTSGGLLFWLTTNIRNCSASVLKSINHCPPSFLGDPKTNKLAKNKCLTVLYNFDKKVNSSKIDRQMR